VVQIKVNVYLSRESGSFSVRGRVIIHYFKSCPISVYCENVAICFLFTLCFPSIAWKRLV